MTSIEIKEDLIPELKGQSAIVTGMRHVLLLTLRR